MIQTQEKREVIKRIGTNILANSQFFLNFLRQERIICRNTDPAWDYIDGFEVIFIALKDILKKYDGRLDDLVFANQLYSLGLQLHHEYIAYLKETNQEGFEEANLLLNILKKYYSELNESQLLKLLN